MAVKIVSLSYITLNLEKMPVRLMTGNPITPLGPSFPRKMLLLLFFPCLSHLHHHPNSSILLKISIHLLPPNSSPLLIALQIWKAWFSPSWQRITCHSHWLQNLLNSWKNVQQIQKPSLVFSSPHAHLPISLHMVFLTFLKQELLNQK